MAESRGNTSVMKSTAGTIRADAEAYGAAQEVLFQVVNDLKNSFTSTDGQAYIARINEFKDEFDGMKKKLESSAETLETLAINYENTIKNNTI